MPDRDSASENWCLASSNFWSLPATRKIKHLLLALVFAGRVRVLKINLPEDSSLTMPSHDARIQGSTEKSTACVRTCGLMYALRHLRPRLMHPQDCAPAGSTAALPDILMIAGPYYMAGHVQWEYKLYAHLCAADESA